MSHILLLVLALCTDTFVASIAYGANRVHISWEKIAAVNGICSGLLGIALLLGKAVHGLLPEGIARGAAFFCLLLLGAVKLLDYIIKKYINSHVNVHKDLSFSISGLSIIINIYGNPLAADWDHSKSLSWKETAVFSLAMSLDSLLAGTLSGFLEMPPFLTAFTALIFGTGVMYGGLLLGHRLASEKDWDLSWVSGILFILLAFGKL